MWWVIFFIWFFILTVLLTACAVAPMASYRDPQTGALCWGRLDAEELRCGKGTRPLKWGLLVLLVVSLAWNASLLYSRDAWRALAGECVETIRRITK